MNFNNFKRLACSLMSILTVMSMQAQTGIFKRLTTHHQYAQTDADRDANRLQQINKSQTMIQQALDLTNPQKQLLSQYYNHLKNIDINSLSDGPAESPEMFFNIMVPAHIIQSKQLIDIPMMTLLKYCPELIAYNLFLYRDAEQKYNRNQVYWNKELKKPNNKNKDPLFVLIKKLKPQNFKFNEKLTNKSATLTEQMLINFFQTGIQNFQNEEWSLDSLLNHHSPYNTLGALFCDETLPTAIQTEKRLQAQGYETFFHARRWSWNFVNDVCQLITSIHNPTEYHANKHILRFRPPHCDTELLYQYRTELIDSGPDVYVNSGFDHQGALREVTCMNKTMIHNISYFGHGECTSEYYYFNESCSHSQAERDMLEKMIEEYDLAPYFKKYKKEIDNLILLHQKIQRFGELLCIAIKKQYVSEMVYTATPGGMKYHESVDHCIQQDLQAFSNPKYLDEPFGECHFYCLAVSDIPGEYNKKYYIESICLGDKKLYAQYCAQRDKIFAKIKSEYLKQH